MKKIFVIAVMLFIFNSVYADTPTPTFTVTPKLSATPTRTVTLTPIPNSVKAEVKARLQGYTAGIKYTTGKYTAYTRPVTDATVTSYIITAKTPIAVKSPKPVGQVDIVK